MSATPGKAYTAAYALWRRDAQRSRPRLTERAIEDTWPRVRRYYVEAADVALLAADQAPDDLVAAQAALGHKLEAPTIRAGDAELVLDLDPGPER